MGNNKSSNIGDVLRERGRRPAYDIAEIWIDLDDGAKKKLPKKKENNATYQVIRKITNKSARKLSFLVKNALKMPRTRKIILSITALSLVVLFVMGLNKQPTNQGGDTLGAAAVEEQAPLPIVGEDVFLEFPILYPSNSTDIRVVQVNPKGSDPAYTYIDRLLNNEIRVTQQRIPESFKTERASKLKELADSFQASSIIQIDGDTVYHGYSEKGRTQSLVFIKKDLLILIASPLKLNDDVWVGYITALK